MIVGAIVTGCVLLLFVKMPASTCGPALRRIEYWWSIAAFLVPALMSLSSLLGVQFPQEIGVLLAYGPATIIGSLMLAKGALTGHLSRFALPLVLLLLMTGVWSLDGGSWITPLVSGALYLPALVVPYPLLAFPAIMRGIIDSLKLFAIALATSALLAPGPLIGSCRLDKCSVWGVQIGPGGTGNAIGLIVVIMAAFTMMAVKRWRDLALVFSSALLFGDATGSRSALLLLLIAIPTAIMRRGSNSRRNWRMMVPLVVSLGAVVYVATGEWSADAATGRGQLWTLAQRLIRNSPIWGYGPSFWVRQDGRNGISTNYASHNLLLETLVSFGAFGLLVLTFLCLLALRGVKSDLKPMFIGLFAVWIASGITEVVALPGRTYILATVVPFLLLATTAEASADESSGSDWKSNTSLMVAESRSPSTAVKNL